MAELDTEIRSAGAVAIGAGRYALGRGYLALDDYPKAREQLESAWQQGFREPRAAYALALVMGHLYQQSLLAAERIEQKDQRDATKRQAETQYRDPALAYLAASSGAEVPSSEYVAALVAFYAGKLDDALHHVDAIGHRVIVVLRGARAARRHPVRPRHRRPRSRRSRPRARSDFEAGRQAYAAAAAVGQSVPGIYKSVGELEHAAMAMELYGKGDVVPAFDHAMSATGAALAIMPDHYDVLVLAARIRRSMAEYKTKLGSDVADLLANAITDVQHAVASAEQVRGSTGAGEDLQAMGFNAPEP